MCGRRQSNERETMPYIRPFTRFTSVDGLPFEIFEGERDGEVWAITEPSERPVLYVFERTKYGDVQLVEIREPDPFGDTSYWERRRCAVTALQLLSPDKAARPNTDLGETHLKMLRLL